MKSVSVTSSFFLLLALGSGCGVTTNESNGLDHRLSFFGDGAQAVGIVYPVAVVSGVITQQGCTFTGPTAHCSRSGHSVTALTAASCSAGCSVSSATAIDGIGMVQVLMNLAGTATLSVTATLDDGSTQSDRFTLTAITPTRISTYCTWMGTSHDAMCPGRYAIFTGATFAWQATPEAVDASGNVTRFNDTGMAFTIEGSTLAPGTGGGDINSGATFTQKTIAAGTSKVHITFGSLERVIAVRSVDPIDVTSLVVRRWAADSLYRLDTEGEALSADAAPTTFWYATDPTLKPVYEGGPQSDQDPRGLVLTGVLGDGAVVLGGAASLTSSDEAVMRPYDVEAVAGNPGVFSAKFRFILSSVGDATLSGSVGQGHLNLPVHVIARPPGAH